jgi:hypothetical protein
MNGFEYLSTICRHISFVFVFGFAPILTDDHSRSLNSFFEMAEAKGSEVGRRFSYISERKREMRCLYRNVFFTFLLFFKIIAIRKQNSNTIQNNKKTKEDL